MFLAGFFTVGQFSFWGNYLPRVYPLHLRGTGESFAANIGGRLIGTSFAWLTATLAVTPDRAYAPTKVALCRGRGRLLGVSRRIHRELLAAGTAKGESARLMRNAIIGAILIAAVSTLGDFVWAGLAPAASRRVSASRTALSCFSAWAPISDRSRTETVRGALYGAAIGLAAAGSFYVLAPVAGYSVMFFVWAFVWIALAVLVGRVLRTRLMVWREILTRVTLAMIGSGLGFYLISGIWRPFNPQGWDYAVHFLSWTVAYLPGFLALLYPARRILRSKPAPPAAHSSVRSLSNSKESNHAGHQRNSARRVG